MADALLALASVESDDHARIDSGKDCADAGHDGVGKSSPTRDRNKCRHQGILDQILAPQINDQPQYCSVDFIQHILFRPIVIYSVIIMGLYGGNSKPKIAVE